MTGGPYKYFAIFGAMRTGSNLLERNLSQYEGLSCFGELFNPSFIGKAGKEEWKGLTLADREKDPSRLIRKMMNSSDGTLPGFRIFQGHDPRVFRSSLNDPECAKIVLRRRPIDSYVSLKIARVTDQWMLGNAPKRRTAKIRYDGAEYGAYLEALAEYEAELRNRLQVSGQTAFEIRYEDLKSTEIMNGLATFLGLTETRNNFDEKIKRQNPEPLAEKVENYDEMVSDLGGFEATDLDQSRAPSAAQGIGVKDLIICRSAPVLFGPVPGVNTEPALSLMGQIDGNAPENLGTGLNQKELAAWQDGARDLLSFAVVDHPLERAYRVFLSHIFPPQGARFPKIRRRLQAHFDVSLPDDLEDWDTPRHGNAFEAFLVFLKSNLAGQTSIRIDPCWEQQHKLLAGLGSVQPLSRIIRSAEFPAFVQDVALRFDVTPQTPTSTEVNAFPLGEIYERRLENLARAAYAKDYRMFGFSDWTPS